MSTLLILRPGMFTTVQDLGRWGFQSRGVPVSGAMDRYSHRLSNRLVDNSDDAATLEVTLMGPQIQFEDDMRCAVTGAAFDLVLDGAEMATNRMIQVRKGAILTFGRRRDGARSYLAVGGGVDVPNVLGSRSTHVLTSMGGLEGRALRAGDRIGTATEEKKGSGGATRPLFLPRGGARLRVLPAEQNLFEQLSSRRFHVSPQSDRMGYRLEGSPVDTLPGGRLISRAVAMGTVQVTPAGQPILLMADHATTGGYPIGATVISADLPLAGQLAPGDWIEFEACALDVADRVLRKQEAALGGA